MHACLQMHGELATTSGSEIISQSSAAEDVSDHEIASDAEDLEGSQQMSHVPEVSCGLIMQAQCPGPGINSHTVLLPPAKGSKAYL